jgi:alpha-D-ribose 1-methylphosphonate 5-triphosphate synthase subunit PhnH
MSAVLSEIGLAWEQPVHGAQQSFRTLLAAMSHPGRIHTLPPAACAGVEPPGAMSMAAAVSLLTLLDAESSVHFAGLEDASASGGFFRFHCGAPTAPLAQCQFAYAHGSAADAALSEAMQQGSDAVPQEGARWCSTSMAWRGVF